MRGRTIEANLGDFIVAVTDEVVVFIQEPSSVNLLVARIVSDALPQRDTPMRRRLRRIIASAEKE